MGKEKEKVIPQEKAKTEPTPPVSAATAAPIEETGISAFKAKRFADRVIKGKFGQYTGTIGDDINIKMERNSEDQFVMEVKSWIVIYESGNYKVTEEMISSDKATLLQTSTVISFPMAWFSIPLPPIEEMIGSDRAMNIAKEEGGYIAPSGGMRGDVGIFILNTRIINGKLIPMWLIPHKFEDFLIRGIRADNGEIVFPEGSDEWTTKKPPSPLGG